MAGRVHYKGYVIRSSPELVAASGQWRLRITIYWKASGILYMQPFSGPTIHDSEEEADVQGIAYGQRIVDEKGSEMKCAG